MLHTFSRLIVFICLLNAVNANCQDDNYPSLPFTVKWDVSPKDSSIKQEFQVEKYRSYQFDIVFGHPKMSLEKLRELQKFTGDASYHRVTQESADTDYPVDVPEYTPEEREFLRKGGSLVGGTYFKNRQLKDNERLHAPPAGTVLRFTKAGAGVAIPVHIKIEQIDNKGTSTVIIDKKVNTVGVVAHGLINHSALLKRSAPLDPLITDKLERRITEMPLRPGKYRISIDTTKETTLPPDITTLLHAGWDPRFVLKDADKR